MDTRNKAWADDKTKFGYRMLQKMGWTEGKGLGAKEDGITEHIKLKKRITNAGIGTNSKTSDVWKVPAQVATSFNDVLARIGTAQPPVAAVSADTSFENTATGAKRASGFFRRRAQQKNVRAYSENDLREIFGGASLVSYPAPILTPAPERAHTPEPASERETTALETTSELERMADGNAGSNDEAVSEKKRRKKTKDGATKTIKKTKSKKKSKSKKSK